MRLPEIPFFWLSCFGRSDKIEKPPLLGLVNVALSHYRSAPISKTAGISLACRRSMSPVCPIRRQPIRVGSTAAIVLADPTAKVGYAEFTGQGLARWKRHWKPKRHMMAVLGRHRSSGSAKGR